MYKEIERKYLLKDDVNITKLVKTLIPVKIVQGYITPLCVSETKASVRVRIVGDSDAVMTVKENVSGITRVELENEIPLSHAKHMMDHLMTGKVEKKRYIYHYYGLNFEIDVFSGDNEGLVVVEVELKDENQEIILPDFIGREVTFEPKYFNLQLAQVPYKEWTDIRKLQRQLENQKN